MAKDTTAPSVAGSAAEAKETATPLVEEVVRGKMTQKTTMAAEGKIHTSTMEKRLVVQVERLV